MSLRRAQGRGLAIAASLCLASFPAAAGSAAPPSVPEGAFGEGATDASEPRVEARLLVHPDDALRRRVRVGVLFDLDPGWHLYWRNPGDSGLPTELRWRGEGVKFAPVAWPAPSAFQEADGELTTYGYDERVLLATEAALSETSERVVHVEAEVLACRTECIPASFSLHRALGPVGNGSAPETRRIFERFARSVPRPPAAAGISVRAHYSQSAIRPGDSFTAAIAVRACSDARGGDCDAPVRASFFPDRVDGIELRLTGRHPHPSDPRAFFMTVEGRANEEDRPDQRLKGVLTLENANGRLRHAELDLPLPRAPRGAPIEFTGVPQDPTRAEVRPQDRRLAEVLLLALLGGLVLNLMPCVLPVLAIKAIAITEMAGRGRRALVTQGVAYTAGILVTMSVLAGVVAVLRALGTSVGWGFQFQQPWFATALGALLVVFALNLFGVFEVTASAGRLAGVGQTGRASWRSFWEGLLAVALATPCSAPFLGTAVGFALVSPTPTIFAIFGFVGLGLALPFLLIALVPASARFVPRSGPWTLRLRALLGFALLGTAVWLVWIVGRSTSVDGMTAAVGFLVVVAFATWLYGALQASKYAWPTLAAAVGLVLLAIALAEPLIGAPRTSRGGGASPAVASEWSPFDRAEIAARLGEGRPVFVRFTASWCITCAVNDRWVIADERVQRELRHRDVALFVADWTRRDEAIRAELARFGRAGVPMYLVYQPTAPRRPHLLPELLTVDLLVRALRGERA